MLWFSKMGKRWGVGGGIMHALHHSPWLTTETQIISVNYADVIKLADRDINLLDLFLTRFAERQFAEVH